MSSRPVPLGRTDGQAQAAPGRRGDARWIEL